MPNPSYSFLSRIGLGSISCGSCLLGEAKESLRRFRREFASTPLATYTAERIFWHLYFCRSRWTSCSIRFPSRSRFSLATTSIAARIRRRSLIFWSRQAARRK